MTPLLILTVGTGTRGEHSNLAQGLVNTLGKLRPRLFWLVPSTSPESLAVAELVRDGAPTGLPVSTLGHGSALPPNRPS